MATDGPDLSGQSVVLYPMQEYFNCVSVKIREIRGKHQLFQSDGSEGILICSEIKFYPLFQADQVVFSLCKGCKILHQVLVMFIEPFKHFI